MILRALHTMLILAVHYHEVVTVGVIQTTSECEVERSFGRNEMCLEGFVLHFSYNSFYGFNYCLEYG